MDTNDNNNSTPQNLWDAAKAVLRGKYIATQDYLKKEEQSHIQSKLKIYETRKRKTNESQSQQ